MLKCTAKEIIKEVPDVQAVMLPEGWFDDLDPRRSVFTSLYDWMLKSGWVPDTPPPRLDCRTYVGEKLFKKLCAAEKKRHGKVLRVKGEELESALWRSDLHSGPKPVSPATR